MKNLIKYLKEQHNKGKGELTIKGNSIHFDGSKGVNYTDTPILKDPKDIYYIGCGCTWGIDDVGDRYWKLDKNNNKINKL